LFKNSNQLADEQQTINVRNKDWKLYKISLNEW